MKDTEITNLLNTKKKDLRKVTFHLALIFKVIAYKIVLLRKL